MNLLIDSNTFTDVDNVFFIDDFAGPIAGDEFTFTQQRADARGRDRRYLPAQRFLRRPATAITVVINWNINNTIDGETGVRGLNELSTQATHANRPNTAATDINAVNAIGTVTDTFVNDDWGTAGRFTDPDGIGTGFGPIAFGFNTFDTIQEGVDAASVGGTVGVLAGTYPESVSVNKAVSVLGPQDGVNPQAGRTPGGPAEAVVQATNGSAFVVVASGVTIGGLSITAGTGAILGVSETTSVTDTVVRNNFIYDLPSLGVAIASGSSGFQVVGNEVFNNYAGVYLSNAATGGTIEDNLIRDHTVTNPRDGGSGIVLEGDNQNVTIIGNTITGNQHGVYVWTVIGGSDLTGTTVLGNSIAGNTAGVK